MSEPAFLLDAPAPPSRAAAANRRAAGFTLAEMLAAVAIVAVLAGLALSGWQRQLERGWRAQARAALAQRMLALQQQALDTAAAAPAPADTALPRYRIDRIPCPAGHAAGCVGLRARPLWADPCGDLILYGTGEWLHQRPGTARARPTDRAC